MTHYLQPNFFQFPNAIADEIMKAMTPTQFICLVVVIRKTRGWHKESDAISLSQFQAMTGIKSKKTIMRALKVLEAVDLVAATKRQRVTTVYELGPVFYGKKCTSEAIAKITTDLYAQNTPDRPITVVSVTNTKESINKERKGKARQGAQVKRNSTIEGTAERLDKGKVHKSTDGIDPVVESYLQKLHEAVKA